MRRRRGRVRGGGGGGGGEVCKRLELQCFTCTLV